MNCEVVAGGLIELARAPESIDADARAASAHIAACAACRARFERQRELTAGLRALATSVVVPESDAVRERALLAAFHVRKESKRSAIRQRPWIQWAAAAAVALAVTAVWMYRRADVPGPQPAARRTEAVQAARPNAGDTAPGAAGALVPSVDAVGPPTIARPGSGRGRPGGATHPPAMKPQGVQLTEFTPLPSAVGLPALESGRILRLEVPAAMLPAYGLVVPDAVSAPVPVDMLVGQDGQPRAVRLAGVSSDQRSRR